MIFSNECPTICPCVDSVWEQEKLEARKILENAAHHGHAGLGIFVVAETYHLKKIFANRKVLNCLFMPLIL
jgi:hypothetical protein